jgi:hypothetical protein
MSKCCLDIFLCRYLAAVLHCHESLVKALSTDGYFTVRFHYLLFLLSRLESLEAVAAAAAENDDVRFTLEHENERLQQQLVAAVVTEQSLTTQLQVPTTTYTCERHFIEHHRSMYIREFL